MTSVFYRDTFTDDKMLKKAKVCRFYLNNRDRQKENLCTEFKGLRVNHNFTSKYLEIMLNRSLTLRNHIEQLQKKLKTRVNLI